MHQPVVAELIVHHRALTVQRAAAFTGEGGREGGRRKNEREKKAKSERPAAEGGEGRES